MTIERQTTDGSVVGAIHELPLPFNPRNADVISTHVSNKRT
ncbi:hypothetical protein THTE_0661 [Thermogutta terrifontis]|uniref:Uncharacterized protein n=1 Tax=Thermogutta terrifontis TaxID=1331910 RepID=A0A286RBC4_9BACT|nr:hypothetical protein THTE_0661 [Thermogutta terrifontis]